MSFVVEVHSDRVFVHTAPAKKKTGSRESHERESQIFFQLFSPSVTAGRPHWSLVCANLARTQLRIVGR